MSDHSIAPSRLSPETHQRNADKLRRIPIKVVSQPSPPKPAWLRISLPTNGKVQELRRLLREHQLHTVCEEAACPNLGECFSHGTATFMIMGDICTRRCPFCDVAHGKPAPLDNQEPQRLADATRLMQLRYVVITSVDRDDLRDGGGAHFAACIAAVRAGSPDIRVEILVPDFRGRQGRAMDALQNSRPDVFNHNLETVPRLYPAVRPGADYLVSLDLLASSKLRWPRIPTKSGLMLGIGEEISEVEQVMEDLRLRGCELLTLGQYLQPSRDHLPVQRYVQPNEFKRLEELGYAMGFSHVASAPLVRSSYHADQQARDLVIPDQECNASVLP